MRRLITRVITGFTVGLLVGGYPLIVRQGKHIATLEASLPNRERPKGIAAVLVRKVTAGKGFLDSHDAIRQFLALGGVATWNAKSNIAAATAPAASTLAIPEEVATLALEAHQRATAGTLNHPQLENCLRDMGTPVRKLLRRGRLNTGEQNE